MLFDKTVIRNLATILIPRVLFITAFVLVLIQHLKDQVILSKCTVLLMYAFI